MHCTVIQRCYVTLRSDNGPQFVSGEFQTYLTQCGIRWVSTTPLWPQANGEVERANRTILKVLKIAKSEGKDLERALVEYVMAYKATPHTVTGITPFSLMFGREMRTKLPMLSSEVTVSVEKACEDDAQYKQKMKDNSNKTAQDPVISQGDTVVMRQEARGKLDTNFNSEPHQVVDINGSEMMCASPDSNVVRRQFSFAKKVDSYVAAPGQWRF